MLETSFFRDNEETAAIAEDELYFSPCHEKWCGHHFPFFQLQHPLGDMLSHPASTLDAFYGWRPNADLASYIHHDNSQRPHICSPRQSDPQSSWLTRPAPNHDACDALDHGVVPGFFSERRFSTTVTPDSNGYSTDEATSFVIPDHPVELGRWNDLDDWSHSLSDSYSYLPNRAELSMKLASPSKEASHAGGALRQEQQTPKPFLSSPQPELEVAQTANEAETQDGTEAIVLEDEEDADYQPRTIIKRRRRSVAASQARLSKRKPAVPYRSLKRQLKRATGGSAFESEEVNRIPKPRPYICLLQPYGCTSTFTTKNEWKRHFNHQHLRLDFYRCNLCADLDTDPNDFNRIDLFHTHLRRLHEDANVGEVTDRCSVKVHNIPTCLKCLFCSRNFAEEKACNDWLEHVGNHLSHAAADETGAQKSRRTWELEGALRDSLLAVGAIASSSDGSVWRLGDATRLNDVRNEAYARKMAVSFEQ